MDEPILRTQGLYKFYGSGEGRVPVVRDVSLEVAAGRFVTVMGPSGSGKSTLLHMVSGLEPPSSGTVHLGGLDLYGLSERRRTLLRRDLVGFVFQFYNLIPNLTVDENIRLPLMIGAGAAPVLAGAGVAGGGATGGGDSPRAPLDHEAEVARLVEVFQLGDKLKSYPHQLSGGEMQRVSVARALVSRPAIIMADEPTGNISSQAGEEVMQLFRRSCDEMGQTLLLVTHNSRDALFSDEVHFIKDGHLHAESSLSGAGVTADGVADTLARLRI